MASTEFELRMAETIRCLLELAQELKAANYKQKQEMVKMSEKMIRKDLELEQLHNELNDQDRELMRARLENSILREHHTNCSSNNTNRSSQQKDDFLLPLIIRLLVWTGYACSFGCFFGLPEDDNRFRDL